MMRMPKLPLSFSRMTPALLTFFFSLIILATHAQQRQISGKVKDEKGSPLASVTVSIKGGTASAATGEDGSFIISAKDGDVLVFSAVSFQSTEVLITSASSYAVVLTPTLVTLT